MPDTTPILRVEGLEKRFPGHRSLMDAVRRRPGREVRAVDGVSFEVMPGEVLALVGESGCGKTTTGNLLLGLTPSSAGRVTVDGHDVGSLSHRELLRLRRTVQMIFQDPYESLNPRMQVAEIVAEPLRVHGEAGSPQETRDRVRNALVLAGMTPPEAYLHRLPFELSGGQRQRVVIAAALALQPQVLVADEPVSMLDVSIRADILNLLRRLADDHGIAILMITHDLSTVAAYADRIAVMYLGRIVEIGDARTVLADPQHPYTRALRSVVPVPDPSARRRPVILSGETPDPSRIPSGCRFHPRCPVAFARCPTVDPPLYDLGGGHLAACLLVEDAAQAAADAQAAEASAASDRTAGEPPAG
ncbi:MAG TPA: ABC transporter ATP-binding protein [Candidatus Limnocylindrales bacterium]|nr:ABC transporter ATP-binding protein [Candidatus Limnocylindrales bacterium]